MMGKTTYVGVVTPDGRSTREPTAEEQATIDRFVAASLITRGDPPLGVRYVRGVGSVFFSFGRQRT
jgi:hypothetical protein